MIQRRGLLAGLGVLLAAPAIIRTPGLLMPVVRPYEQAWRRFALATHDPNKPDHEALQRDCPKFPRWVTSDTDYVYRLSDDENWHGHGWQERHYVRLPPVPLHNGREPAIRIQLDSTWYLDA